MEFVSLYILFIFLFSLNIYFLSDHAVILIYSKDAFLVLYSKEAFLTRCVSTIYIL